MSTSIILLDQTFNANDVDIMVFEPSVLFPNQFGGGIDDMVPSAKTAAETNFCNNLNVSYPCKILFKKQRGFPVRGYETRGMGGCCRYEETNMVLSSMKRHNRSKSKKIWKSLNY